MVFFDPASAKLTPQARAILDNAAASYRTCGPAAIYIMGHTDRKGADEANMALSKIEAASVRAYLISRGLPAKLMVIRGFGETRPLVETADGVSEPQNRRVEIVYQPEGSAW
ncbi:OmpA family protein [Parablastomonas sp. CN1-191]|uniref:OmpA family protein n=1 Tax=Parablastomonas sp. CN1-191 TaxID=3400908 RepID=UPI003BF7824E